MVRLVEKRGLIIAIASAFIATILVITWLNQQQRRTAEELSRKFKELHANTVDAIYAKVDISRGKIISEDMLFTKPMTKNSLPPEAATSVARVIDRIAAVNIKEGSIIQLDMIGWPATKETTLAMKTPIGKRAITVPVDNISSLMGMIRPGDYVDVISLIPLPAMTAEGKQATQPAMVPLFQNVQVLAVGSHLGRPQEAESGLRRRAAEEVQRQDSAPLITLALNPEEINLLAFVQEQGKIRLVLRSQADAKIEVVQPASWETLLRYLYPNMDFSAKEAKKEIPQVEVIRGPKREMVPLRQTNER